MERRKMKFSAFVNENEALVTCNDYKTLAFYQMQQTPNKFSKQINPYKL